MKEVHLCFMQPEVLTIVIYGVVNSFLGFVFVTFRLHKMPFPSLRQNRSYNKPTVTVQTMLQNCLHQLHFQHGKGRQQVLEFRKLECIHGKMTKLLIKIV